MLEYLDELNDNQFLAVTAEENKILVMAGAGSGKTRVLTTRIKYLLDSGVQPSDIVAFTFTNKAANEMLWRLNSMLKDNGSDSQTPIISTFHSFCYSYLVISDCYTRLGFTAKPSLITDTDKGKLIKEILNSYEDSYSNIPFVRAISQMKNKARITGIDSEDKLILNSVYYEYQEKLKQSNMIDFDDMIPLFLELCRDESFLDFIQVKYVLVDECQDTNQIQYDLIRAIGSKYNNIFMVGDEDQLIYSFRNSDISILKDFQNTCDKVIILNQNYRCNKDILGYANSLIGFNSNRLDKILFSNIEALNKVKYQEFDSQAEEANAVSRNIKRLLEKGIKPSNIAVLFRNNNQSYPIEKELNAMKLPYTLYGGKPFFDYKEIRSIIYTYRLLFNPRNEIAFESMYNQVETFEVTDYKRFIDDYHMQNKLDIITFASGYGEIPKFQKLGFTLLMLKDEILNMDVLEFYMLMLEKLHYIRFLKESNMQKPQYHRLMILRDMIRDLNPNQLEESFNQMILDNVKVNPRDSISLLTIHKAKGLEFEVVFVIGFNEGIIPGYQKQGEELEEERRLAYVAMTRAKQQLYLYCSIIHFLNGNMSKLKPSTFLSEAGIEGVKVQDFYGNYWYNH